MIGGITLTKAERERLEDQLSPHFRKSELACKCCGKLKFPEEMVEFIERVRNAFGKRMIVTSGYRCAKHNMSVGGKSGSAHVQGLAVDFAVMNGQERYAMLRAAIQSGAKGIGIAEGFMHMDIMTRREHQTLWVYPTRKQISPEAVAVGLG